MSIEVPFYGARRLNATMPLARLQVSDQGIWLGTTAIAFPSGLGSVQCDKDEVVEVFKSRGLLTRGVGITTTDGKTHYFWSWRVAIVLGAFSAAGYPTGSPRRPKASRLLLDQAPWPWRRPRAVDYGGADRAREHRQPALASAFAERTLGPPTTRLSRVAAWRSRSRLCAALDWLVGAAGLALTVVASADSVVSWPSNSVLVYPSALERLAGALLLPSWAWVLVSSWLLAGFVGRRRLRAGTPALQYGERRGQTWTPTIRALVVAVLVVLAIVVIGFVIGAAKGSLRILPNGAHQVSADGLNSANWTTVTPAAFNRWAARFVREDAAFGFFGVIMVGFSLLVHKLRISVRLRENE
jgi:hypothetical protein